MPGCEEILISTYEKEDIQPRAYSLSMDRKEDLMITADQFIKRLLTDVNFGVRNTYCFN